MNQNTEWLNTFNALCYEVFYKNEQGAQLLNHLENKYFRSPVAFPDKEPSWAYFNEGQREIIRLFTVGIQAHMKGESKGDGVKQMKREIK